jgi:hypothetical protein
VIAHVYQSVWLVGGFAASPWLFSQLQERLAPLKVTVSRPDSQTSVFGLYLSIYWLLNFEFADQKQSQTVRSASTATTMYPLGCPSICMEWNSFVNLTHKIKIMLRGRIGYASYHQGLSSYLTHSTASWHEYAIRQYAHRRLY